MKMRIAVPINKFHEFEVIFPISEDSGIISKFSETTKILSAELSTITAPKISDSRTKIIQPDEFLNSAMERLTKIFTNGTIIYRLWIDKRCYIEEIYYNETD